MATEKEKEIQELMKNLDFQKKFSKLVSEFSDDEMRQIKKMGFTLP